MADQLPPGFQRPSSGCGIQGCLFGAVAVFVLLLIGMLVISIFRFSQPPQGPMMGPRSSLPAAPAHPVAGSHFQHHV